MLLIVSVLTGCSMATVMRTFLPVTGAHSAGLTSSPQIGGPTANVNASLSSPNVVGAGSFPRSLLIPGTRYLDSHRPLQSTLA
jgi:hypothetical protein